MITSVRKNIGQKLYKLFLWFFLFMMALGSGVLFHNSQEKCALRVYEQCMNLDALQRRIQKGKTQQKNAQPGQKVENVERAVMVQTIADLLTRHAMDELKVQIPEFLVQQTFEQIMQKMPAHMFQKDGSLNMDLLARVIAPETVEGFFESLQDAPRTNMFQALVGLGSYTPKFECHLQYLMESAQKELSILTVPLKKYIAEAQKTAVSDEQLKRYYAQPQIQELCKTTEKRSGMIWKFDEQNFPVTVTDVDSKKEYERNKEKYQIKQAQVQVRRLIINGKDENTKKKIDALYDEATTHPEQFVDLVKKESSDKSNDGLSELFEKNSASYDRSMVEAAFALTKDGQISTPVETEKGYEMLQRVKRTPAIFQQFESVHDQIKKNLTEQKFKQRFGQAAHLAISRAAYEPELLDKLLARSEAEELSLADAGTTNEVLQKHLFKTAQSNYATYFDRGTGYILRCTEIVKSRIPSLDEVKELVKKSYYEDEGKKLLKKALQDMVRSVEKESSLASIAQEYGAKVEIASLGKDHTSQLFRKHENVAKVAKNLFTVGAIGTSLTTDDGMVLRLDKITTEDQSSVEERLTLQMILQYVQKYRLKEGFIASLYRRGKLDGKIEIEQTVLANYLKEA